MNRVLLAATALIGVAAFHHASATTTTATIAASATVTTVCTLTTTPLVFGEVALTAAGTPGTATVNVTCTDGGTYNVGLDNGVNAVSSQRTLVSGTNTLDYDLYSDTAHTVRWGNTVGTDTVAGTGSGSAQALTVYGLIAGSQTVHSGTGSATYTDTVQVTVTY